MKQLLKINNADLSFRLNLNYNNVYSRLKMLLGRKASLFADISTKSTGTAWYSDDDAEYLRLSEAPKGEVNSLSVALNEAVSVVRKELSSSPELANYVDDILEIPDNSFVFYRVDGAGYKFILSGWGCKYAHQSATDPNSGFIKRISKNLEMPDTPVDKPQKADISQMLAGIHNDVEPKGQQSKTISERLKETVSKPEIITPAPSKDVVPPIDGLSEEEAREEEIVKKTQHVAVCVIDQNNNPVDGEVVRVSTSGGGLTRLTSANGIVEIGNLPYGESFGVSFPNVAGTQERAFEVEPGVEIYNAYIKKLVKYTPLLYIEDQNGNAVHDYDVKVVIKGQDTVYNSGMDGVIQLPTMQDGQKFVVIDTANYANTAEYCITPEEAKFPYRFPIRIAEKTVVGITVLDKLGKPMPKVSVNLQIGDTPCSQETAKDGRAEFPYDLFVEGNIPVVLNVKGKGKIRSTLKFTPDNTEYTIQLQGKNSPIGRFDWRWLALIPLLLLLGFGGYKLYDIFDKSKVHSIAEMESGVVLTLSQTSYWVDVNVSGVTMDGVNLEAFYFIYDMNADKILYKTFDKEKRLWGPSTGTGFLVSEDGLIATNRHNANPIPPSSMSQKVKMYFQNWKDSCQSVIDNCNNQLHVWSAVGKVDQEYVAVGKLLVKTQEELKILDKILNTADFTVHSKTKISVAFTGTRIEDYEELYMKALRGEDLSEYGFHKCSVLESGEPGGLQEIDISIIQLKEKAKEMPEKAFIFTVPETDLVTDKIPDDYEITVLGYNAGTDLQNMKFQDGIKPQAQHGKITNTSEKYRVGYDAPTLGGSSGSPVLNKNHELVAINNSGIGSTQGFNYGIRTKYLKELLDKVQKKSKE